jgi:hypothetical protein
VLHSHSSCCLFVRLSLPLRRGVFGVSLLLLPLPLHIHLELP